MDVSLSCCSSGKKKPVLGDLQGILRAQKEGLKQALALQLDEHHRHLERAVEVWWAGGQAVIAAPPAPIGAMAPPLRMEAPLAAQPVFNSPMPGNVEAKAAPGPFVELQTVGTQTFFIQDELALSPPADAPSQRQMSPGGTETVVPPSEDALRELAQLEKPGIVSIHETATFAKRKSALEMVFTEGALLDPAQLKSLHAFANGHLFEVLNAILILLNSVLVTVRVQYNGNNCGFIIGYPEYTQSAAASWPGASEACDIAEVVFGCLFTAELLLKGVVLRREFFKGHSGHWNIFDMLLVGGWAFAYVLDKSGGNLVRINPMMLRMCQLFRVMHVVRLFEAFKDLRIDSLLVLVGSIRASLSTFFWSCVLLTSIQMLCALVTSQVCHAYIFEFDVDTASKMQLFKYFGTFTKAMFTLFELSLANWSTVVRAVGSDVGEFWAYVLLFYVLFLTFAVAKVITAAFIIETNRVCEDTLELVVLEKERHNKRLTENFWSVFASADSSGDGSVDWPEFQEILSDRRLIMQLEALDFDANVCEGMFALLDDGDGHVSFNEFIAGVKRLKGPAKSVDVVLMAEQQTKMFESITKLELKLESQLNSMVIALHKMA